MEKTNLLVKKQFSWFVFVLLMVLLAGYGIFSAKAEEALDEGRAFEIAYAVIEKELALTKEELIFCQGQLYEGSWLLSFRQKERDLTSNGLVFIELNSDGTLAELEGPSQLTLPEQLLMDFNKHSPFTIESMYQLKEKWRPHMEALGKLLTHPQREVRSKSNPRICYEVLSQEIGLPGERDIERQEAFAIATKAIATLPGWSKGKLDMFELYFEIYYHSAQLDKPVYQYAFSQIYPFEGKYENSDLITYQEEYEKPLFAMFGGDSFSTPLYIVIRIDAQTGEICEEPNVGFFGNGPTEFEWVK